MTGMTENTGTAEIPAPPPPRRRLERPQQGRTILGVCAAVGRYTDVDPVVYRVILVVLTVFGGIGAVLYGVGWLLIPEEGHEHSVLEHAIRRRGRRLPSPASGAVAVAIIVLVAIAAHGGARDTTLTVLLVGLITYLLLRHRDTPVPVGARADYAATGWQPPPPPPGGPPVPGYPAASTAPTEPLPWSAPVVRERSPLGVLTLSAALVVAGVLTAIRESGADRLSVPTILASTLAVIGLGLVAGAWWGRSRWLVVPGALLAIATVTASTIDVSLAGGIGQRQWTPAAGELRPSYHLGIGEATLDLDHYPATGTVHVSVGVGDLRVIAPAIGTVDVSARSGAGRVDVFGVERNGLAASVHRTDRADQPSGLHIIARVGAGRIEVQRAAA
jgi:phage shock protein PspC (stress-responsive transcriptional regulator)